MLLTEELIDRLYHFRLEMMQQSTASLQKVIPNAKGAAIGAGYATFAGDGSPLTQVYGVGHRDAPFDLDELEAFYKGLTNQWELIFTPFANPSLMTAAVKRGYVPDHFETVLAMVAPKIELEIPEGTVIEEVSGDLTDWMRASDAAWSGQHELPNEPSEMAIAMSGYPSRRFWAVVDGEPASTASLIQIGDVSLLAGGGTRLKFRRRGLQQLLTNFRLKEAVEGSLVQVVALPGSQSHRNLQRVGFQPLYSKLIMLRQTNST